MAARKNNENKLKARVIQSSVDRKCLDKRSGSQLNLVLNGH